MPSPSFLPGAVRVADGEDGVVHRDRRAGREVAEAEVAFPEAALAHGRENLPHHRRPVLRLEVVDQVVAASLVQACQADEPTARLVHERRAVPALRRTH